MAPEAWQREGGIALVLRRAAGLGAEVGMLRHERLLVTPADAAALLADPLLAGRAARGARGYRFLIRIVARALPEMRRSGSR